MKSIALRIIHCSSILVATIAFLVAMALSHSQIYTVNHVVSVVLLGTLPIYLIASLLYILIVLPVFSILGGPVNLRARTWLIGVWSLWGVIAGFATGDLRAFIFLVCLGGFFGVASLYACR